MEWSMKPPYHWDREQAKLNREETTSYNPLENSEWYNQRDPEFGFGSLILTRDGRGWDSPVSDLLNSSSLKSLKSASASLNEECKDSNVKADDVEVFLEGCCKRKEIDKNDTAGASPPFETSAGSNEQLFLSLKLGKGMYNEDAYYGKAEASLSVMPPARQNRVKKYKSTYQTTLSSRCQVEGCNIDLSSAKEYHRKHRVCEIHSRSPKVIVAGLERRFCQQCSRFHNLFEFDEEKRSCRKRLSDHNSRRRKSHPKVASFNQGSMSSVYDARLQMSLSSDRLLPVYQRPTENLAWEGLCSAKHAQSCQLKPEYSNCRNGQQHSVGIEKPFTITVPHCNSNKLLPTRGTGSAVFNQGFKECRLSSSMSGHQDFDSAFSLLSTNSWSLCELKNILAQDHKQWNQTSMSPTKIPAKIQSTPVASDHVKWSYEHNSSASGHRIFSQQGDGGIDFQLVKSPLEIGVYPDLSS